jgi:endonuclease-3
MADSVARQKSEAQIRAVAGRLAEVHPVSLKVRRDPLDELVLTVLSQNTSDTNCYRGWEALRERYSDWNAVLGARGGELERTIRPVGLARQKAETILAVLARLSLERGELSLDHLEEMSDGQALDYLTGFRGVGVKTAACVMCFALGRDLIPVDTHVHRLAVRLGLVPEGATAARTHKILNEDVPLELRYELHVLLIRHGRLVCKARQPRCEECVLAELCPRVGLGGEPAPRQ